MSKFVQSAKKNLEAGFSLVELMVVVTIIGILAGVAVPRFQTFRAKAQQAEAKSILNGFYLHMVSWQTNYNQFPVVAANSNPTAAATTDTATGNSIGFRIDGQNPKYGLRMASAAGAFASTASTIWGSNPAPLFQGRHDYWRINTNKVLCAQIDIFSGAGAGTLANTATTTAPNFCPEAGTTAATLVAADNQ